MRLNEYNSPIFYIIFFVIITYFSLWAYFWYYYTGQNYAERVSLIAVAVAIIVISIIHLFIEVGQLLMLKSNYLADWTNYVDVVLFIFSIMFVSSFSNCLCPSTWQWQLGSVAVFLAWINLLIYLRMLPGGDYSNSY